MIPVLPVYVRNTGIVKALRLGEIEGQDVVSQTSFSLPDIGALHHWTEYMYAPRREYLLDTFGHNPRRRNEFVLSIKHGNLVISFSPAFPVRATVADADSAVGMIGGDTMTR